MPDNATVAPNSASQSFALNANGLDVLSALIAERHPARILELGSGRSTARLAGAAATYGAAVVSLEHDETYLLATLREVGSQVTLVHAPIRFLWVGPLGGWCYDPPGGWDPMGMFDFAFIDGPPARTIGRWLTLPLIWSRLTPGSLVVLHDADRALEQRWLRLWMKRYGKAAAFDLSLAAGGLALITKLADVGPPGPRIVLEFWVMAILHRIGALVSKVRHRSA